MCSLLLLDLHYYNCCYYCYYSLCMISTVNYECLQRTCFCMRKVLFQIWNTKRNNLQNELLRQSNEQWKTILRISGVFRLCARSWKYYKNDVSILSRKQTTKEWLILPIYEVLKCVSYVKCEMGSVQNDTRNENYLGWSVVTHAHKSKIYMGG
jgi:hypothetical protein